MSVKWLAEPRFPARPEGMTPAEYIAMCCEWIDQRVASRRTQQLAKGETMVEWLRCSPAARAAFRHICREIPFTPRPELVDAVEHPLLPSPLFERVDGGLRVEHSQAPGDCFILGNQRGEWWTGAGWSADVAASQRFNEEPDPDRAARNVAASIQAQTGLSCWPFYISADQASTFFRERRRG